MTSSDDEVRRENDIPHTTPEERDRAGAVHSVPDETRIHAEQDETETVQGAGGELRTVEGAEQDDDQDAEATMRAPDDHRPDGLGTSGQDDEERS